MTPDQLRCARNLLDYTQEQLGEQLGISGKHISDLERGAPVTQQTSLAVECVLRRHRRHLEFQELIAQAHVLSLG